MSFMDTLWGWFDALVSIIEGVWDYICSVAKYALGYLPSYDLNGCDITMFKILDAMYDFVADLLDQGSVWHIVKVVACVAVGLWVLWCIFSSIFAKLGYNGLAARRARYHECLAELTAMVDTKNSHPILLRLAWSDVGSFDCTLRSWPQCGGANGAIRFDKELDQQVNKGLDKAIALLEPIKERFPVVTWADLIQMAGAIAVERAGGPVIDMVYGRVDAPEHDDSYIHATQLCPRWPYPEGAPSAQVHIRNVFYRMGFTNREIVALCGAHTLGRAFEDRSGVTHHSSGDQGATQYTSLIHCARHDKEQGVGMAGGCSWTKNWLCFDNSYFRRVYDCPRDSDLLWLPTDRALHECPEFRPYFEQYATNQEAFFADYAKAHSKMASLGAHWDPEGGFSLDAPAPAHAPTASVSVSDDSKAKKE